MPLAGTGATRRGPSLLLVAGVEAVDAVERLAAILFMPVSVFAYPLPLLLPQLASRVLHEVDVLGGLLPSPAAFLRLGELARAS